MVGEFELRGLTGKSQDYVAQMQLQAGEKWPVNEVQGMTFSVERNQRQFPVTFSYQR